MLLKGFILVAGVLAAGTAFAQHTGSDQSESHAKNLTMKTELENDAVEVIRIHLDPHQKVPTHDVTPRVVIWLTDARLRATFPDGTSREERATAGQIEWVPAQRHAAENLDDHPVDFIAVIPKAHNRLPSGK